MTVDEALADARVLSSPRAWNRSGIIDGLRAAAPVLADETDRLRAENAALRAMLPDADVIPVYRPKEAG